MSQKPGRTSLKKLRDQVIVITGASSGIGLVTARKAAAKGARIVLVSRSPEALRALADELTSQGHEATIAVADVANLEDVRKVAKTASQIFGGFDTWINNAGVSIYGNLIDTSIEDHRRLFETNYWGVVHGSLIAAEHLKARGGAIINIGSVLSDRAIPIQGAYCASKHAVKGFTDALRMELEKEGLPISVSLVKPSSIDTPYKAHAKNYLPVEPNNPPPVYAPEIVAEAILHCAEHPTRDVFVGAGGKALSLMGQGAPRLSDALMELALFDLQQTTKPNDSMLHRSLHEPSGFSTERGNYGGHVAESSLYTRAALHPWIIGGLLSAGFGIGYLLRRSNRFSKRESSTVAS
jgi:short-subunit dehydrogenase